MSLHETVKKNQTKHQRNIDCPFCFIPLHLFTPYERLVHTDMCSGGQSPPPVVIPPNSPRENPPNSHREDICICMFCGKDITHLPVEVRTRHVNRCLDKVEKGDANAPSSPLPVPIRPSARDPEKGQKKLSLRSLTTGSEKDGAENHNGNLRDSEVSHSPKANNKDKVYMFLLAHGLARYYSLFQKEEIDMDSLQMLSENQINSLPISALAKKRLLDAIPLLKINNHPPVYPNNKNTNNNKNDIVELQAELPTLTQNFPQSRLAKIAGRGSYLVNMSKGVPLASSNNKTIRRGSRNQNLEQDLYQVGNDRPNSTTKPPDNHLADVVHDLEHDSDHEDIGYHIPPTKALEFHQPNVFTCSPHPPFHKEVNISPQSPHRSDPRKQGGTSNYAKVISSPSISNQSDNAIVIVDEDHPSPINKTQLCSNHQSDHGAKLDHCQDTSSSSSSEAFEKVKANDSLVIVVDQDHPSPVHEKQLHSNPNCDHVPRTRSGHDQSRSSSSPSSPPIERTQGQSIQHNDHDPKLGRHHQDPSHSHSSSYLPSASEKAKAVDLLDPRIEQNHIQFHQSIRRIRKRYIDRITKLKLEYTKKLKCSSLSTIPDANQAYLENSITQCDAFVEFVEKYCKIPHMYRPNRFAQQNAQLSDQAHIQPDGYIDDLPLTQLPLTQPEPSHILHKAATSKLNRKERNLKKEQEDFRKAVVCIRNNHDLYQRIVLCEVVHIDEVSATLESAGFNWSTPKLRRFLDTKKFFYTTTGEPKRGYQGE